MRIFTESVFSRAGARFFGLALSVTCLASTVNTQVAHASGPVERMVQVLVSPLDRNVVIVRYGVASQGYLFSSDGGRSFKAMCSEAISPMASASERIDRLTGQLVPGAAATLIDTRGKLLVSQIDGLWSDDGAGCSWTQDLKDSWPYSLKRDPKRADELIAVVNTSAPGGDSARSALMRRSAEGAWLEVGTLLPDLPQQRAYGGDLVASATATGTQLYATVSVSDGAMAANERQVIVGSSDDGKTWSAPVVVPDEQNFVLLAIDPIEPKRILATKYRDNASDTLVLSDDQGKTWRDYQDVRETAAVTFAPDGRVYIADAGDSSGVDAVGGLWTAAKLGEPLTLVAGTSFLDCAEYEPTSKKLLVCKRDRFGLLDPVSGAFEQYAQLDQVPALIECAGTDVAASCSGQLNAGASWCCAGHYPFTPFCGQYDVTMSGGKRLYCGLSGRAYDQMSGRGPNDGGVPADGGAIPVDPNVPAPDGGVGNAAGDAGSGTPAGKSDGDGCSLVVARSSSATTSALASLSVLCVALGRGLRRRRQAR